MNIFTILTIFGLFLIINVEKSQAMLKALNTSATGMAAQEAYVNTISNNIANVNTNGFKKGRAEIEDLLYETIDEPGARSGNDTFNSVGLQIGTGSKVSSIKKEFSQGVPQLTNNPFDLMVNGDGFFAVTLPNGQLRFTRDGSFGPNSTGLLVNRNGYPLAPGFTLPPTTKSVSIGGDGTVEIFLEGQVEPTNLGQIPIFTFINPPGLKSTGGNLYLATSGSGAAIQNIAGQNNAGQVQQGALEASNVSIMVEMTDLIKAQRAYEMNSKVMGIADKMLQTVNSIR